MKKNKISKNWLNKQRRDIYVRKSQVDGYRARSVYKLIEIEEKFKIFKNGISVVDLGACPGSWSQYVAKTFKNIRLVSIDLKEMDKIENSVQIKGDFTETASQNKNIFEALMNSSKICSLGEITNALFEVGGQYRRNM